VLLLPEAPFALQVEVTSKCNLRCMMCPLTSGTTSSGASSGHIGSATWAQVLAAARRSRQVFMSGFGEPLTNPACLQLLSDLDALAVRTTLVTNGLALSAAIATRLATLENLVHVNVSIDSPDARQYREIRGGSLDRALRGLSNLMAAFSEVGRADRVSVSSVVLRSNVGTLTAFPDLLARFGVGHYVVQGLVDYNGYAQAQRLPGTPALRGQLERLRAACEARGVELVVTMGRSVVESLDPQSARVDFFRTADGTEHDTRQCLLPWEIPYIDKDGSVFSCCYAASGGAEPLGRLGPADLDQVWTGAAYQAFRRDLLDGRTTPSICRSCTAVRLGPHPLREYRATLAPGSAVERGGRVSVRVRNAGTVTWGRGASVNVGTTSPRDGASALYHSSWLRDNRACSFREGQVAPGEVASFEFQTALPAGGASQEFQVVAENVCWLPNTRFTIEVPANAGPGHSVSQ
jgi:MoaA/NifB/PqqE/SkfB family radical SAM enzyme